MNFLINKVGDLEKKIIQKVVLNRLYLVRLSTVFYAGSGEKFSVVTSMNRNWHGIVIPQSRCGECEVLRNLKMHLNENYGI